MKKNLFQSYQMGNQKLKNRLVMAPMTRSRAKEGNVSNDNAPLYYSQRASAGLIITEASQISNQGIGYINTPGIHTLEQIEGWKKVTNEVHKKDGVIYLQLWHVGRVSHPDFHKGELPVAPSAIGFDGEVFTSEGMKKVVTPKALEISEIKEIITQFGSAAANAKKAGFDGVEIHGANGYLPQQFLSEKSNFRTDEYGGSIENRAKFLLEVTDAAIAEVGASNVGVRVSPSLLFNGGLFEENPEPIYGYVAEELSKRKIAYLHLAEFLQGHPYAPTTPPMKAFLRKKFQGTFIVNGGYDFTSATSAIENDEADLVSFGTLFLANPDLPKRFENNLPLNAFDQATFYGGDDKGYTDYPFYNY